MIMTRPPPCFLQSSLIRLPLLLLLSRIVPTQQQQSLSQQERNSYLPRVDCPISQEANSFTSYIGLSLIDDDDGDIPKPQALEEQLQQVHRAASAQQCDPYQRSLTEVTFLQSVNYPNPLALFQVQVNSYGTPDPKTALEPPHPNFVTLGELEPTGDVCHISDIVTQQPLQQDSYHVGDINECPFDGCYCDAKPGEQVSGVTEDQLAQLLGSLDLGKPKTTKAKGKGKGKGKGGKRQLGSKGKGKGKGKKDYSYYNDAKGKKSYPRANADDAIELNQFDCPAFAQSMQNGNGDNGDGSTTTTTTTTAFLFELNVNPCIVLTPQEQKEFARELVEQYNLFQFNNCDPGFRRLGQFDIADCQEVTVLDPDGNLQTGQRRRRTAQNSNNNNNNPLAHRQLQTTPPEEDELLALSKFLVFVTLLTELPEPRAVDLFTGDVRRRKQRRGLQQPNPSSLSRQLDTSFVESEIDYGIFNGQNGTCYCSAFYPGGGTGRGITDVEFQFLSNQIMIDVTDSRALVEGFEEVNIQECGEPQIFTQTISVIANPGDASNGALENLGVAIGQLLDQLSRSYCVDSYFQILQVNLVFSERKKDSKSGRFAWALLYEVQYVAFGVTGKAAELFRVVKIDNRSSGKKQYGNDDEQYEYEDSQRGRRRLREVEDGVASFQASAEHGARLAAASHVDEEFLMSMSEDHHDYFQNRGDAAAEAALLHHDQESDFERRILKQKSSDPEGMMLSTICICSFEIVKDLEKLPLALVNRKLNELICDDGAVPGIDFAIIMH